jgi:hypothetical protein
MTEEETGQFDIWYGIVEPNESLTQGDLILDCPLIGWKTEELHPVGSIEEEALEQAVFPFKEDVIVMTQACDLEQAKVSNVVLCPCIPLSQFRSIWKADRDQKGLKSNNDSWKSFCREVTNGFRWNLAIINSWETGSLPTEHRVVDFHEVYTVPRVFLESFIKQRGNLRLRLLPPYREHLSQAFARFFMRVGLPTPISKVWESQQQKVSV